MCGEPPWPRIQELHQASWTATLLGPHTPEGPRKSQVIPGTGSFPAWSSLRWSWRRALRPQTHPHPKRPPPKDRPSGWGPLTPPPTGSQGVIWLAGLVTALWPRNEGSVKPVHPASLTLLPQASELSTWDRDPSQERLGAGGTRASPPDPDAARDTSRPWPLPSGLGEPCQVGDEPVRPLPGELGPGAGGPGRGSGRGDDAPRGQGAGVRAGVRTWLVSTLPGPGALTAAASARLRCPRPGVRPLPADPLPPSVAAPAAASL